MSSSHKENNYTKVPNEVLEALPKAKLNGTQRSILDIIVRQTYGYHREDHDLSVSFIANGTDINERQIKRELNTLIEKDIVIVTSEATFSKSRRLKINEDCSRWLISTEVTKKTPQDKKDTTPGDYLDTRPGDYLDTQIKKERKLKENTMDLQSIYDYYLTLDLVKHRNYTNDMAKAIRKAMKDNKYDIDYCKVLLKRHEEVVRITKKSEYPVKVRGLAEFFGQKVRNATHLICSEYDEGGNLYERHLRDKKEPLPKRPPQTISFDRVL